jgi:hypothetical protein
MSYLPDLRSSLVDAARRRREDAEDAPRRGRPMSAAGGRSANIFRRRPRGVRAVLLNAALSLVLAATGLTAAGVFRRGTPVGPEVPPSPTALEGVAVPGSVELLPLRVPDPAGGPPWGLRVLRTTRGLTCVQIGRVEFGTIGVLGQDGAFADDGRFHPLSPDVNGGQNCSVSDAHGNGFVNVSLQSAPASADAGYESVAGHCVPTLERYPPGFTRRAALHEALRRFDMHSLGGRRPPRERACPPGDLRNLYYGLLGPDAVSITYPTPGGGLVTTPTSGSDGAYLVIRPPTTVTCRLEGPRRTKVCGNGDSSNPGLVAGVITAVHYRDGHVCRLPTPNPAGTPHVACPPVGYAAPAARRITAARVAAPVRVRMIPAKSYCEKAETIEPCGARTPPGFRRLAASGWPALLVQISFTSRIAIPDSRSYYEFELTLPHSPGCTTSGLGGPTNSDIRAGRRVATSMFVPYRCPGVVHGTVAYRAKTGPASSMSVTGLPGQNNSVLVGRFSFVMP